MSHWRLPLSVDATGGLAQLEDGSDAEIAQSAAVVLNTRIGERADEPTFGTYEPLFGPLGQVVVDTDNLAYWERRATADTVKITMTESGGGTHT